jgi:hypothetical protein
MISTRCKGLRESVFLAYLEGALTSLLEKMMDLISPLESKGEIDHLISVRSFSILRRRRCKNPLPTMPHDLRMF